MARPSVREERAEEILDAFERCIVSYGVEGASLQRIADEAGLARGLLRHHLGNREDLIAALAARFVRNSEAELAAFLAGLPARGRLAALVEQLFDPAYASQAREIQVAEALITAAQSRPELRAVMLAWYRGFEAALAGELRAACPDAPEEKVLEVATALTGLYLSIDSLTPLGPLDDVWARSRAAALGLVAGLDGAAPSSEGQ